MSLLEVEIFFNSFLKIRFFMKFLGTITGNVSFIDLIKKRRVSFVGFYVGQFQKCSFDPLLLCFASQQLVGL